MPKIDKVTIRFHSNHRGRFESTFDRNLGNFLGNFVKTKMHRNEKRKKNFSWIHLAFDRGQTPTKRFRLSNNFFSSPCFSPEKLVLQLDNPFSIYIVPVYPVFGLIILRPTSCPWLPGKLVMHPHTRSRRTRQDRIGFVESEPRTLSKRSSWLLLAGGWEEGGGGGGGGRSFSPRASRAPSPPFPAWEATCDGGK